MLDRRLDPRDCLDLMLVILYGLSLPSLVQWWPGCFASSLYLSAICLAKCPLVRCFNSSAGAQNGGFSHSGHFKSSEEVFVSTSVGIAPTSTDGPDGEPFPASGVCSAACFETTASIASSTCSPMLSFQSPVSPQLSCCSEALGSSLELS